MKDKFKFFQKKIKNLISKINIKKGLKVSRDLLINEKVYLFMFFSLYILDISTRYATNNIGFLNYTAFIPNLFSFLWIFFIIYTVRYSKNIYGKLIYGLFFGISFAMFLVHNIYYIYFKSFFDFSILSAASEGSSYLLDALRDIKPWMYFSMLLSLILMVLTYKYFSKNKKTNFRLLIGTALSFLIIHSLLPVLMGSATTGLEWNAWSNKRNIYNSFNDNNKSMQLVGLFEYNTRNFYINFLRNNKVNDEEGLAYLDELFSEEIPKHLNKYTGLFEGKNLIFVQLESIDNFLITEEIMPNLYNLKMNSLNFNNHYSFVNGGGSTFNSEFMVTTGYATPYTYNQNAYTFNKNNFDYSMPNLFKSVGYSVNAFHMNSSEYYSRGVSYKNFGYDSYNGLKDLNIYPNKEYYLDRELLLNEQFNSQIFNMENTINNNFVSYIITYSAHTPFVKDKGVCNMLLPEEQIVDPEYQPTEFDCLKIQAGETDYMVELLMNNLKEKGLYDNTVIIFYADHYIYTLSDKSILDIYKDTETNLINKTDFFIWSSDISYTEINKVTSQLNILPTVLNLFNLYTHPNYYIGEDALDDNYTGYVFFSDFSWYDGKRYVTSTGEITKGLNATPEYIEEMAAKINNLIKKNDDVLKLNYFNHLKNSEIINS